MARFYTDIGEHPTQATALPPGWTFRTTTGTIVNRGVYNDSHLAEWTSSTLRGNRAIGVQNGNNGNSHASLDAAGSHGADIDVIGGVRASAFVNLAVGLSLGNIDWSVGSLTQDRIRWRANGSGADVTVPGGMPGNGGLLHVRYQRMGGRVKVNASQTLANITGATPTQGWLVDIAEPNSGYSGRPCLFVNEQNIMGFLDWMGVGTAGDLAPTEPVSGNELTFAPSVAGNGIYGLVSSDPSWSVARAGTGDMDTNSNCSVGADFWQNEWAIYQTLLRFPTPGSGALTSAKLRMNLTEAISTVSHVIAVYARPAFNYPLSESSYVPGNSLGTLLGEVSVGSSQTGWIEIDLNTSGINLGGVTHLLVGPKLAANASAPPQQERYSVFSSPGATNAVSLIVQASDVQELDTPTGVVLEASDNSRAIYSSWNAVPNATAYEYQVDRSSDQENWVPFQIGSVTTNSVSFDDSDGVQWDTWYRIRVRAVSS